MEPALLAAKTVEIWRERLDCVVVRCSVLQCHAVWCSNIWSQLCSRQRFPRSERGDLIVLQCAALCCSVLQCGSATTWGSERHKPCICVHKTLWLTAAHCNTLQHTATHCNTLKHTVTHCDTLQHTATHWGSDTNHVYVYIKTKIYKYLKYLCMHVETYICSFVMCRVYICIRINLHTYIYTNVCVPCIYVHTYKFAYHHITFTWHMYTSTLHAGGGGWVQNYVCIACTGWRWRIGCITFIGQ